MADGEYRAVYPKLSAQTGLPPVQYKETLIIPTRERTEPDGRGRKPRVKNEEGDELSRLLASMSMDDDDDDVKLPAEEGEDVGESAEGSDELELPGDLDLETDTEIAKLAEEFNNTIDTNDDQGSSGNEDDDEYGGFGDEDDEFGKGEDDDEYGGGSSRGGYGGDYDE
jgi:hypothetical protein